MFYLTMHSTHFIYGYTASDIWLKTILIVRKETCCRHIGYSYRITARVLLYAQTGYHIPQPLLPLVEHWLEREIAQWVHPLSNSNMSLIVSGLLSDAGMMFVASQLGFEWTLVTLSLGLTQAQIEQIQMSYPQQAFRQITTALTTWRDARDVSDDEKISQLLTTFETEEIGKTELAELIRERYGL